MWSPTRMQDRYLLSIFSSPCVKRNNKSHSYSHSRGWVMNAVCKPVCDTSWFHAGCSEANIMSSFKHIWWSSIQPTKFVPRDSLCCCLWSWWRWISPFLSWWHGKSEVWQSWWASQYTYWHNPVTQKPGYAVMNSASIQSTSGHRDILQFLKQPKFQGHIQLSFLPSMYEWRMLRQFSLFLKRSRALTHITVCFVKFPIHIGRSGPHTGRTLGANALTVILFDLL